MRRRRNTQVSQIARAGDNIPPGQGILLAIHDVDLDDARAIKPPLDEFIRQFMPDLDRATESNGRVECAPGRDAVDGLRTDGVGRSHALGVPARVLHVASVEGFGREERCVEERENEQRIDIDHD